MATTSISPDYFDEHVNELFSQRDNEAELKRQLIARRLGCKPEDVQLQAKRKLKHRKNRWVLGWV
jgi:hypothetical protein